MQSGLALKWKLLGLAVVLLAAGWIIMLMLRPQATVVRAVRDRAINAVPGSVTVMAERTHPVKSEVGGRILKTNLALGAQVKAGGVLVELDPAETDLQIAQLEQDRDTLKRRIEIGTATKFDLINERETLETKERLHKQGNLPLSELERQRRLVQAIEQKLENEDIGNQQQLARVENELKTTKLRRDRMIIRAPVDGVITAIEAQVGDLIGHGQTVATLISDARIVEAKISEENFAGIKLGQKATVRFLSYGASQFGGHVAKILPAADPLTQRYMVHLEMDGIDRQKLVPGLTGEVNIIVDAREKAVLIPRRAVFGRNVFVVSKGRVELRTIEIGFTSLNLVEVLKGVDEGEDVIVEDLDRFRRGDRVSTVVGKP